MGYMKALADERVFRKDIQPQDIARSLKTPNEALDVAIGFEKDSIIFLYEMREMVGESQSEAIEKLLTEEKTHIRKLSEMKASLA